MPEICGEHIRNSLRQPVEIRFMGLILKGKDGDAELLGRAYRHRLVEASQTVMHEQGRRAEHERDAAPGTEHRGETKMPESPSLRGGNHAPVCNQVASGELAMCLKERTVLVNNRNKLSRRFCSERRFVFCSLIDSLQCGGREGGRRGKDILAAEAVGHLWKKTVTDLGQGSDVAWPARVVAQRLADLSDALDQSVVGNRGILPNGVGQVIFGYRYIRMFDQIQEHAKSLVPENSLFFVPE